jgi:ABC-2 type transport system ATP-binding protein
MSDDALLLDRVTKRFGAKTAVNQVSMRIPRGSVYGFLGKNGAGKTTTIRMIMSIFYPDEGSITILGEPNAESLKERLGYLPEEKGLYKKMRVGEILAFFGKLKGMPAATANERARELLTRYGLGENIESRCEELSKGMGQKVQILGTIIHNPELVILDEPFSGLDPVNIELMRHVILDMKKEGRTVIFSTHIMAQAESLCDYVLIIDKGQKIVDGTLAQVKGGSTPTVQLDYDGDGAVLQSLPGVSRVNDSGKQVELTLAPGADAQQILAHLVGKIVVRRFDIREPSLHEIFVRAVGGDARE